MSENNPTLNRAARRSLSARKRKSLRTKASRSQSSGKVLVTDDVKVYHDDSYKNRAKVAYTSGMQQVKERVAAINAKFRLPEAINTVRIPFMRLARFFRKEVTTALVINRDGRTRDFLPDDPGRHVILCHRSIARHLVSACCMLVRISACEDSEGKPIDGSWAIVPAQYSMMRTTTIQHLRRRPFFFLRRYWYEISFDGRVQPAHMLFDYNIDPTSRRTRFRVTHEYVPVRDRDETNDYFRFWAKSPGKSSKSSKSVNP